MSNRHRPRLAIGPAPVRPLAASRLQPVPDRWGLIVSRLADIVWEARLLRHTARTLLYDTSGGELRDGYAALLDYPAVHPARATAAGLYALRAGVSPPLVARAMVARARLNAGLPAEGVA